MKMRLLFAVIAAALSLPAAAQVTLHGASQFNDEHAFTKALVRFEELVKKYYGKPVTFVLHKNSELGLEKDYFAYMNQGKAVDYAIVSPAHMSTFSKAAPFIDAPFLFRDLDHWNKVLDADVLKPVADEIAQKAEVMLIGYAGGGTRNIFVNKPVRNMAELKALKVRVQGRPIWSRTLPRPEWRRPSSPTTRSTTRSRTASSPRARTRPPASSR
jgi:TRAP-type C4-dicarboxylate transport system substrate-binding protein